MGEEMFSAADLIRLAVEDEKVGMALYSSLAETARQESLRSTFQDLASQEASHLAAFQDMLEVWDRSPLHQEYPGEYMEYLHALVQERAFPDEAAARREALACRNDNEAIGLASRMERDTLMLLHELDSLLPQAAHPAVDAVVMEERDHLLTLAQARRALE